MSGEDAGIYAIAEVIKEPLEMLCFQEEEEYWVNEEDKGKKHLRVEISIKYNLTNNPILKAELKNIKGLEKLRILYSWRGTNFPVKYEEWLIIHDLIKNRI